LEVLQVLDLGLFFALAKKTGRFGGGLRY